MTKELVEVVQADRDAAADWATAIMIFTKAERDAMREGVVDHATLVQAFARHRVSAEAAIVAWQPIGTAPKDGTLLELVVDYTNGDHPLNDATRACTIGFNSFDDDGVDEWKFAGWCWSHDHFVEGAGKVIAWRPSRLNASDDELPPLPAPPADTLEQGKIRHG